MQFKFKWLIVVPLLAAMGPGLTGDRPPPPPAALPRTAQPAPVPAPAPGTAPAAADALRVLSAADAEADPAGFLWRARPVVVFADTPENPSFVRQVEALRSGAGPLLARDVVVIADADPVASSPWRRMLRPEGFSLVLLDKDGQVKLRKPSPWTVREITRSIDKFPSRLQEVGRAGLAP